MFRNIRNTIKDILPNQQTGINKLKVPIINDREEAQNPDEFQAYIANNTANNIVWDTIIDQPTIKKYILQFNRKSFWAAASSPCGHGLIYDSLTFALTKQGTRFPGNWDVNLRWLINGSYMKQYLMDKHKWKEQVWRTIDFLTLKLPFHTLSPTKGTQRFKFMHNLQSTGHNKHKMNSHKNETSLNQCPCCQTNPENQSHFLTCNNIRMNSKQVDPHQLPHINRSL